MIDLNRYVDPYGPARDFLPEDAWEAEPSDDEEDIWREARSAFYVARYWWPDRLRVVWFDGSDPRWRGRTYGTDPRVILLRVGLPPRILYEVALHELKHVDMLSFAAATTMTREEFEEDAEAFVRQMLARERGGRR